MQKDISILPHLKSDCKSESEDFTTPRQIFRDGLKIGSWKFKLDDISNTVIAVKKSKLFDQNNHNTRRQLKDAARGSRKKYSL